MAAMPPAGDGAGAAGAAAAGAGQPPPPPALAEANIFRVEEATMETLKRNKKACMARGSGMLPSNAPGVQYHVVTKLIAVYNFKGGVGKTSLSANLGARLAERGHRVLIADCDPQANLTSLFMPNPDEPAVAAANDPIMAIHPQLDGQTMISKDEIKQQSAEISPSLGQLDQGIFAGAGVQDFYDAVLPVFDGDPYSMYPPDSYLKVDALDPNVYGDRLLVIPGTSRMAMLEDYLANSRGQPLEVMYHTAFRAMLLSAAEVTNSEFVIVDLGPSASRLNATILVACDYILPPVYADWFSVSSVHSMLNDVFPEKIIALHQHLLQKQTENRSQNSSNESKKKAFGYSMSELPPCLLPFIVTNYKINRKVPNFQHKNLLTLDCGKFVHAMTELTSPESRFMTPRIVPHMYADPVDTFDGARVIPLFRTFTALFSKAQELGMAPVSLSDDWLTNIFRPHLDAIGMMADHYPNSADRARIIEENQGVVRRIDELIRFIQTLPEPGTAPNLNPARGTPLVDGYPDGPGDGTGGGEGKGKGKGGRGGKGKGGRVSPQGRGRGRGRGGDS